MKKLLKEIPIFIIVCYITCAFTKYLMNNFVFETDFLIDSFFITLGAATGWGIVRYFQIKKENK